MKISLLIEGETERVFLPHLRSFLSMHLSNKMPKIDPVPYDGRIPKDAKLQRVVQFLLRGKNPSDHVIALTDVYTGTRDFESAQDAKNKMRNWVGHEPRFHPHVALHDFEAWLIPYWDTIQKLAGHNTKSPGSKPESVNQNKPPAYHIKKIYEIGTCRDSYKKPRDADRILKQNDLHKAIQACPELKSFINTIISICDGEIIP